MQGAGTLPCSHLFALPDELLALIGRELLVIRHGGVVDAYHLAVFSLTCRRVCLSTRSVLFNHVPLASEAQIESLSLVPEQLLKRVRHLTLYFDSLFIQIWRVDTDSIDLTSKRRFEGPAVLMTFARLLSQASNLRSLSLRVAESFGPSSVWRKFDATPPSLLSLDLLKDAFSILMPRSPHDFALADLTSLRIDAFEGLGSLLKMCPNLRELNVFNSGGFDTAVTDKLVESLRYVPQLRSLSFSPWTIAFRRRGAMQYHSAWLIKAIGEALPILEKLSLETRWLGYGAFFVPMRTDIEDLIDAVSALPNLTHFHLPITLQTDEELLLFKEWRHIPASFGPASNLRALMENQYQLALQRVEERELEAIRRMQEKAPQLCTVSWVRFATAPAWSQSYSRAEVSVEYRFDHTAIAAQAIPPTPGNGRCGRPASSDLDPSMKRSRRRIDISVHDAEEGFEDARPTYMWPMHPQLLRTSLPRPSIKRSVISTMTLIAKGSAHAVLMIVFFTAILNIIIQHLGLTRILESGIPRSHTVMRD